MSETYSIIFRGDILPGHTLPDVKSRMAGLFKLDDAKLAMVFSGKPVALKKDCDAATAEKLKAVLNKAGAEVELKPGSSPQAQIPPAPAAPTQSPPPAPAPKPQAPITAATAAPIPASSATTGGVEEGGLKVAPTGPVLTEAEREAMRPAPVQVDTSHISLEKRASTFMAADEAPAAAEPRPEIQAPTFELFATGADLLKEEEKKPVEPVQVDLSGIELAEAGADLLREDEKAALPIMEIEELQADLAPAGSDMGQLKKEPPPPPPSTDHLSLS